MNLWLRIKRRFFRKVAALLAYSITRLDISGGERLKNTEGTVIVVSNHLGRLDALLTIAFASRDDIIVVVAEKYRQIGIARWLVKQLDLLFLERFESDLGTLREVLRRLQRGGYLVIAPEGTRSPSEALLQGKPGAAFLAAKTNASIIPVGVTGTEDRVVKETLRKFRRPKVHVVVGEPFSIPSLPKQGRTEFLEQQTDEIMARIACLLPERYRGIYANHPTVLQRGSLG
ncbi:MAG: lysophospholipid acyltransferase family protein [Anaerolineales bacterium]